MQYIQITPQNLDTEHICCAITQKKGETCVQDKKAWLRDRFDDGLVFRRLDARGKVFIEYIPAEKAWCPIDAPGYLYIDCLWVSGQFKRQGHGERLLASCIADAKAQGKQGVAILSANKKKPFLGDGAFLKKQGFQLADTAAPYFQLLYLPLAQEAPVPTFRPQAKAGRIAERGFVLYYTCQCPFAQTYVRRAAAIIASHGQPVLLHALTTLEAAQGAPTPWPTYTLYHDGAFVTNEILSEIKLEKLMEEKGLA